MITIEHIPHICKIAGCTYPRVRIDHKRSEYFCAKHLGLTDSLLGSSERHPVQPRTGEIRGNMKVSEVLEKALELFGPNGENWVNHLPLRLREYCMVTACVQSGASAGILRKAIGMGILRKAIGITNSPLHHWNDSPDRTFPEVKAAFQKAIALARQEESLDAPSK